MDAPADQTSLPRPVESQPNTSNVPRRTYPAIVHAAVACALISPIAFLPYFAARRHINVLQQSVNVLRKETLRLRDELDVATSMQRSMTSELRDLRGMAESTAKLSNETRKNFSHREMERLVAEEAIQANLRELLEDSQRSRNQISALRGLGMSLADVAGFMQMVELQFGIGSGSKDKYGIERLRLLALQIQSDLDNGMQPEGSRAPQIDKRPVT
ncbi:hypothetical protein M413DRAFT_440911 [Hebeloma cylindrosporum]|uniref:Uncharacterized protein n=1 Tax=Hebeloma cylindrosporum TaxID=76867 RepID=A0A0C2Y7M1_HEBCY|nr:hypothetical protein M413DRAFT_440911 [Hebeloma cylindrosporum h7]